MDTAQNISSQTDQHTKGRIKPPRVITLFILLIIIISAFILYFLYFAKGSKRQPENQTSGDSLIPAIAASTIPAPTVAPSPKPLLGSGMYACDPLGICNSYEDATRVGCPKTYADLYCLGECKDKTVRCPK